MSVYVGSDHHHHVLFMENDEKSGRGARMVEGTSLECYGSMGVNI